MVVSFAVRVYTQRRGSMQITCRYIVTSYIIILLPIGHPHLIHT